MSNGDGDIVVNVSYKLQRLLTISIQFTLLTISITVHDTTYTNITHLHTSIILIIPVHCNYHITWCTHGNEQKEQDDGTRLTEPAM